MTIAQAKSELMQIYGALSPNKQIAIDTLVKIEPKIGHWIERHDDWGSGIITDRRYKCSICHGKHIDPETGEWHEVFDYKYPFCPNCGCRMVEPQEGSEQK